MAELLEDSVRYTKIYLACTCHHLTYVTSYNEYCSDLRGNPIEVFDIQKSDLDKLNNLTRFYVPEFTLTTCGEGGTLQPLTSADIQVCVYSGESAYLFQPRCVCWLISSGFQ